MPTKTSIPESIGKRIARLRNHAGWTQESLAARLAISRVAVSHIELDLTTPSERTIILLAGVFKMSPLDLVVGSTYPRAKTERLPTCAPSYTQLELDLELLDNDLAWIGRLPNIQENVRLIEEILQRWSIRLEEHTQSYLDERDRALINRAREKISTLTTSLPHKTK